VSERVYDLFVRAVESGRKASLTGRKANLWHGFLVRFAASSTFTNRTSSKLLKHAGNHLQCKEMAIFLNISAITSTCK